MGNNYEIMEDGTNGTVQVLPGWIVRTYKNLGSADHQLQIPIGIVKSVDHDRQMGGDVVTVKTDDAVFKWKLGDTDAALLTAELSK